jgi:hypothetical protein
MIQDDGNNSDHFNNNIGGRILVFSSNICTSGYGAIKMRDDPKLYN